MLNRADGMLVILTDIPDDRRAEFDRWYDREHLAERVAIPGFTGAARYEAATAAGPLPQFAAFYAVERFEVLDSEAYRAALAQQTAWSKAVMAQFRNTVRAVARVTETAGAGQGGVLGLLRLPRSPERAPEARRAAIGSALQSACRQDGVVAGVLLENDPELSRPLPEQANAQGGGADDWFAVLEGTSPEAVEGALDALAATAADPAAGEAADRGIYRLLWQLLDSDRRPGA